MKKKTLSLLLSAIMCCSTLNAGISFEASFGTNYRGSGIIQQSKKEGFIHRIVKRSMIIGGLGYLGYRYRGPISSNCNEMKGTFMVKVYYPISYYVLHNFQSFMEHL